MNCINERVSTLSWITGNQSSKFSVVDSYPLIALEKAALIGDHVAFRSRKNFFLTVWEGFA